MIGAAPYRPERSALSAQLIDPFRPRDPVRRQWEDVSAGTMLAPFLGPLLDYLRERGRGLRVLELGAGAGDSLDYLRSIPRLQAPLAGTQEHLLVPDELIEAYHGLDTDRDALQRGRQRFLHDTRVSLEEWDPETGLRDANDAPYDLYLTRHGFLSRLHPEAVQRLLADIACQAGPRALVVLDWLGRLSYEWQPLWRRLDEGPLVLQSEAQGSLYPASRIDAESLVEQTSRAEKVFLRIVSITDRAVLLGPFMDTGQYNPQTQPLRHLVNQLLTPGTRTPLDDLLMQYSPRDGYGQANAFFMDYAAAWNTVIAGVQHIFHERDAPPSPDSVPLPTQGLVERTQSRLRAAARLAVEIGTGDPRADFVEPYLALALRDLELEVQQGLGCGASMMVIAEVRKAERQPR